MKYDYLVVGAGISGATFAEHATKLGRTCLVIDKRIHVAGNCYNVDIDGIHVHMYGPHLFHTNNQTIWNYVNRFATFNDYHHTVVAHTHHGLLSLPINLATLSHIYGIKTPEEAQAYFASVREDVEGNNIEAWCLRNIGRDLYNILIRGYTMKQWGVEPGLLPESIIRRLPIRTTYDTRYFSDRYQGVPEEGYTAMVERMLDKSTVQLKADFNTDREAFKKLARKIIYTGPLDELFDFDKGKLQYRSLTFEHSVLSQKDFQGIGQVNYPDSDVPYTRITEHKHFTSAKSNSTVVTKEFPSAYGEPYYPINDDANNTLATQYIERARAEGYLICGRMARYQYLDMHQAIAQAMHLAQEEFS